jgi:Asp-tRNA(Asn)/Glu-tRNA(Gln) amidotransferase A subunit family amidase
METHRIEVVNLSRGVFCPHLDNKHPAYPIGNYRYSRIQSTHCEQKQWDAVVATSFGPDLWMHLAMGHHLVVHDYSEKPWKWDEEMRRETRACWQGMALIRYCAERVWDMPITPAVGGKTAPFDMTEYFQAVFENHVENGISKNTKRMIKYFRGQRDQLGNRAPVQLTSCWREDGQRERPSGTGWPGSSE